MPPPDPTCALLDRPHVRWPRERDGFWELFENTVDGDIVRGNLVTLMRQHGVATI